MRVRHILVTTFNRLLRPGTTFNKALDNEWLMARWDIFMRYTVPSVAGQTNLDFEWVVLCHKQSPAWLRQRGLTLNLPCGVHFSFVHENVNLLDRYLKPCDVVLTTRLDSDDGWHRTAMARIRASFEEDPYSHTVLNAETGFWYDTVSKRLALDVMPSPPFQTKIKFAPVTDYFGTGGNHAKLRERYSYRDISQGDPLILRTVHRSNIQTRLNPRLSFLSPRSSQRILQQAFNISDPISDGQRRLGTRNTGDLSQPSVEALLARVARESATLQLLRDDRRAFQAKFNLTAEDIGMLQCVDVLSAVEIE